MTLRRSTSQADESITGYAKFAERYGKELAAQVEMEQIRLKAAAKRLTTAMVNYEIVMDGLLLRRNAKELADYYGVPLDRIYRLRKAARESMQTL